MSEGPLDLTTNEAGQEDAASWSFTPTTVAVDPNSLGWARVVQPWAAFVFGLVSLVVLTPFVVVMSVPGLDGAARVAAAVGWADKLLAPVVGFASAVIAYYFGQGRVQGTPSHQETHGSEASS